MGFSNAFRLNSTGQSLAFFSKSSIIPDMDQNPIAPKAAKIPWKWGLILVFGLLVYVWLVNTPPGILGKADAIGYAVCHRIDLRSFHIGSRQTPLCARCTGMYLGAMMGLLYLSITQKRRTGFPPKKVLAVLAFFFVAFGVDGLNSFLHLIPGAPGAYEPQNWLRLVTGTGMGLVITAILFPAFNQSAWKETIDQPVYPRLRDLGVAILACGVIDLLVLSDNPYVLLVLALISAAGVMVLLTMVYTMVTLIFFRAENRFTRLVQMGFPLLGGLTLGLLQVGALDLVRFWLTGTWEGFHFG